MTFATENAKASHELVYYAEIDLNACSNTYGVAPCTASGTTKCHNCISTCQDEANYAATTDTLTLIQDHAILPGVNAIPCITHIELTPGKLRIGEGLGDTARVDMTFSDFPHHDRGFDPYLSERDYTAKEQGTFWGKLFARYPYLVGNEIRVFEGYVTTPWDSANFKQYTFDIASAERPNTGTAKITGKDILKRGTFKKATCPPITSGKLNGAITAAATSLTLDDATDYNTADLGTRGYDYVAINDEIIKYTGITTNTLTGLTRAQFNTTAAAHDDGDAVTLCKYFNDHPVDVVQSLLVDYAGMPLARIPTADWTQEKTQWLQSYVAQRLIPEPMPVDKLIGELCEEFTFEVWGDEEDNEVKLKASTPWQNDATTVTNDMAWDISWKEKQENVVTRAIVNYGLRNPLDDDDKSNHYAKGYGYIDADEEGANRRNAKSLKKFYSKWIPATGYTEAFSLIQRTINRYKQPPIEISFKLDTRQAIDINKGDVFAVDLYELQDEFGANKSKRFQCISKQRKTSRNGDDYFQFIAYSYLNYVDVSAGLTITTDTSDYNIWLALGQPSTATTIDVTINASVNVTASSTSKYPITSGNMPAGSKVNLTNNGNILGKAGAGGRGASGYSVWDVESSSWLEGTSSPLDGEAAGHAYEMLCDCDIDNTSGNIYGGGGGGAGGKAYAVSGTAYGGGGGGAGAGNGVGGLKGTGSTANGTDGGSTTGGAADTGAAGGAKGGTGAEDGGAGGNYGQAGTSTTLATGGAAGNAVTTNGYTLTWLGGNNPAQVKGSVV